MLSEFFVQPLQMRAVSSPSLTENISETPSKSSQNYSTEPEPNSSIQNSNDAQIHSGKWSSSAIEFEWENLIKILISASSGSVLQKFKRTFFKNGKSSGVALTEEPSETKHHRWVGNAVSTVPSCRSNNTQFKFLIRFGPLVWRSSKERRKTKTHRRDKCNSGDSGIQVELENDENLSELHHHNMVKRIF